MSGLFGIAVLVLWPLVQVPLLVYLARRFELDPEEEGPQAMAPRGYDIVADAADAAEACVTSGRVCRQCGSENDPDFDFCQNCVAPLTQQAGPSPG